MSTTQRAATLFQLQSLDLEVDRLMAEHQTLTSTLQNNSSLKNVRAESSIAQQQLTTSLQIQREAEHILQDLEQRLKQQELRLYSGSVSTAKELSALQQEVQHLRTQQAHQEEVTLEAMDTAENLREAARQKAEALQQAEQEWETANAVGVARLAQVEAQQQELRARRATLIVDLDTELLKRYEGLRRTKQGRAISKVEQGSCQWCRVILTPSELQRVRISSELQTCSNCSRILYYDR